MKAALAGYIVAQPSADAQGQRRSAAGAPALQRAAGMAQRYRIGEVTRTAGATAKQPAQRADTEAEAGDDACTGRAAAPWTVGCVGHAQTCRIMVRIAPHNADDIIIAGISRTPIDRVSSNIA